MVRGKRRLGIVNLSTAITSIFLGTIICLSGVLIWNDYARNSKAALEMAGNILQQNGDKVELEAQLLLHPLAFLSSQIPNLPQASTRPGQDFQHPFLPTLLAVMSLNPQVYSAYFAFDDGEFFQVISLTGRPFMTAKLQAPENASFALRHIVGKQERWRFLAADRTPLATTDPRQANYDPRTRPWYKTTRNAEDAVWTTPYIFSSTKGLGLTASKRTPGENPAVFAVDMTLDSLSLFLQEERPGTLGEAILFDAQGNLIACAAPELVAKDAVAQDGTPTKSQAHVEDLSSPVAKEMFRTFRARGGEPIPLQRIDVDGETYLIQVRPFKELGDNQAFLALAGCAEEFIIPIIRTRDQSLLFSLVLLAFVIPLVSLLVNRLVRKLHSLSDEADRIRTLDLDSNVTITSWISEVAKLGNAVSDMRATLSSFARYIPRTLVNQFMASGKEPVLGGDLREITLLFSDVANFTPISETLAPEDLMTCMSEYFQSVGQAILDTGGTIDKFIGDAIMAFWNAPFDAEHHVELACAAGLRLSRTSENLICCLLDAKKPMLHTRVGIHCGQAVVGNVGAADRMNYTALGATVNLASRLEGLNKFYSTRILVSRIVRDRARKQFLFRSVDVVIPKGTRDPLAIFELVGAMPQSPYPDIAAPRPMLGFCSRWERAITLYRTMQWDKALVEFEALRELMPADQLSSMYCQRTRRLIDNKPGKDWKAVKRFMEK